MTDAELREIGDTLTRERNLYKGKYRALLKLVIDGYSGRSRRRPLGGEAMTGSLDCAFFHELDGQCCDTEQGCLCRPDPSGLVPRLVRRTARERRLLWAAWSGMLLFCGASWVGVFLLGRWVWGWLA